VHSRLHHASSAARYITTIVSIFASQLAIAAPTVDELVREVVEYERRFSGVEVRRFRGEDVNDDSNDPFTRTMRSIEGSVTYEGTIGGRFVAEITRETMPVGKDGNEFRTSRRSRSYDGNTGIEVVYSRPHAAASGVEGRGRAQATILPHSPLQDALDFQSMSDGSAATLGMFVAFVPWADGKRGSLGACLAEMAAKGADLTITEERADGLGLIKIADAWGNAYWLQPDRGYAIRRAVAGPPPGATAAFVTRLTVDELIEIAPQQWYAKRGSWEQSLTDGSVRRTEFTVSDAAKPTTMPARFAVAIPAGVVVNDTTTNTIRRSVQVGDDDRVSQGSTGADARSHAADPDQKTNPVADVTADTNSLLSTVMWMIGVCVAAAALASVWRSRTGQRGS
jgi:hypothetical protein